MRVFNRDKTIELTEYDLALGYLKNDKIVIHHNAEIIHHDAIEGVEEQGHYEVIANYPKTGGRDVEWVIDIPKVETIEEYDEIVKEAYDDIEEIQIYIPYTESELTKMQLQQERQELEVWLLSHDYIGTKIATGRATIEDYADEIAEMTIKANRINEIDTRLKTL